MIDFVGKRSWFFFISALMLIASIASLAIFGLKPWHRLHWWHILDSGVQFSSRAKPIAPGNG